MGLLPSGYLYNIAMGNGPFMDGLPIKNDDFPWLCQITRWYIHLDYLGLIGCMVWNMFFKKYIWDDDPI